MKRLLFFTFTAVLFGSCVSMQPQEVSPALGEFTPMQEEVKRNIEQIEKDAPGFLKRNELPTSEELTTVLDESLTPPAHCFIGTNAEDADDKSYDGKSPVKSNPQSEAILAELGNQPAPGGPIRFKLSSAGDKVDDIVKAGYQRYGAEDGRVYGTARTIWNLQAAGRILGKEGIIMGIGDISANGGGKIRPHSEHQRGNDVDMRLVNSKGIAGPCTINDSSCYSRDKTFTMIKALIDVDPNNVDKILINDNQLAAKINKYLKDTYNITGNKARPCPGHHNHLHFSWKGG